MKGEEDYDYNHMIYLIFSIMAVGIIGFAGIRALDPINSPEFQAEKLSFSIAGALAAFSSNPEMTGKIVFIQKNDVDLNIVFDDGYIAEVVAYRGGKALDRRKVALLGYPSVKTLGLETSLSKPKKICIQKEGTDQYPKVISC